MDTRSGRPISPAAAGAAIDLAEAIHAMRETEILRLLLAVDGSVTEALTTALKAVGGPASIPIPNRPPPPSLGRALMCVHGPHPRPSRVWPVCARAQLLCPVKYFRRGSRCVGAVPGSRRRPGGARPVRMNVYVPDSLAELVGQSHPSVNASRIFQEALRALSGCEHEHLECRHCSAELEGDAIRRRAAEELFAAEVVALEELMVRGGTVEGAIKVIFDVSRRANVRMAFSRPLPRLTRAEREAQREEVAS